MPMKQNLTKYDMLAYAVHKIGPKCTTPILLNCKPIYNSLSQEENTTVWKAMLVAAFSSNHSWQTHKCMVAEPTKLNTADVRRELDEVRTGKWKKITSADICEVVNSKISDNTIALWGYFHLGDEHVREHAKQMWRQLKNDFSGECDVENMMNADKEKIQKIH